MRLDDVNFLGRTLRVQRQVQRLGGGEIEVRPPKKDSQRTVALPDELVDLLAAHARRRDLSAGSRPYLFAGPSGAPPHQNTVGHRWRKLREAAGVGSLRLHDLRHFYASWLINRPQDGGLGLPLKVVQERMGHSSITMTADTYGHLFPRADDADELAAAEAALLG